MMLHYLEFIKLPSCQVVISALEDVATMSKQIYKISEVEIYR